MPAVVAKLFPVVTLLLVLPLPAGELDGTWIEVLHRPSRAEQPGYLAPRDLATLVIDGNMIVMQHGERAFRQSLIKFITGQTPQAADLTTVVDGEFWLTRAIYKLEGDTLTISESGRDKPRPTDFRRWESLDDELHLVTTYQRQPSSPAKADR